MRRCSAIFLFSLSAFAQTTDTLPIKSDFLGISPISILLGVIDGDYEHKFGNHGMALHGQYAVPILEEAYSVGIDYRYHFSRTVKSKFVGAYFKVGYLAQDVVDQDRSKYRYSLDYKAIGIDYGKRGVLWKRFNLLYTYRIGVGYPFSSKISWHDERPESINGMNISTFEMLIKVSTYIDGELSVGWAF
jgi:hypothetical protein